MRVEHDGDYALVASEGGAPENPVWSYNPLAYPDDVMLQDGAEPYDGVLEQVHGEEKALWWDRAVPP
jgi:hypothetical protein